MSRGKISRRTLKRVKVYQGGTISLKSLKTDPFQKSKHFINSISFTSLVLFVGEFLLDRRHMKRRRLRRRRMKRKKKKRRRNPNG